jgi:hypothetical protein
VVRMNVGMFQTWIQRDQRMSSRVMRSRMMIPALENNHAQKRSVADAARDVGVSHGTC